MPGRANPRTGTTPGADNRFTDKLAERLVAARRPLDVAVNRWLRTSGAYDAVLDVDRALADPALPRPGYVFQDGLHPDEAGFHAIASAMDLDAP